MQMLWLVIDPSCQTHTLILMESMDTPFILVSASLVYIYAFHYIYILMSENSTVRIIHKFKFRRSIRKSIQISFQKVYMEGNKSEFK